LKNQIPKNISNKNVQISTLKFTKLLLEIISPFTNFQEIKKEGALPTSFSEASITLIPNSDKGITHTHTPPPSPYKEQHPSQYLKQNTCVTRIKCYKHRGFIPG
jgi:hypothetical protein